ncbi:gamma-glutamylcyclotransferase [Halobacillus fulvus]|nr:gamma-glutamylcyclotransferase [Halobacillus fulvus]
MGMKLFVYGSLCKGERNAHVLNEATCLSEQAWTHGRLMYGESYYPLLVKDRESMAYGELYEIEEKHFPILDRLEGYNPDGKSLFLREETDVFYRNEKVRSFVYYYPHQTTRGEVIEGNWKVAEALRDLPCYYFAYGSCMDLERIQKQGAGPLFTEIKGRGVLENYQLGFGMMMEDGGRADIVEKDGSKVEGVLYRVGEGAVDYLYEREGVTTGNYRPTIVFPHLQGKQIKALSFTVLNKREDSAPPLHYAREIHRGGSTYLSKSYLTELEKIFSETLPVQGFPDYLHHIKRDTD